jgi:3-methyl-2-oxobutanoate hydroxymethyltransferase
VQGKGDKDAERLKNDAKMLEEAGCFSIVLECIPVFLGQAITEMLKIPAIGIGAGIHCDGQVLVFNDLLGIFNKFKPKFVRRYRHLREEMVAGCAAFIEDVRSGRYPSDSESYF